MVAYHAHCVSRAKLAAVQAELERVLAELAALRAQLDAK